jgi:hypothetical protein
MLRRAVLVRSDVSEEPIASIIRVTRIGEIGTTVAVNSNWRTLRRNTSLTTQLLVTANVPTSMILVTLMMEALGTSKTSVLIRATQRNIPEYGILNSHRRENLKSYIVLTGWVRYRRRNVSIIVLYILIGAIDVISRELFIYV